MRRGDLLLTPGWHFHEHHNTSDQPMAWLDGLDIPLIRQLDAGFFEFGPDELATRATPDRSRSERLWGHPGLLPVAARPAADSARTASSSPLMAYRWAHTDAALTDQLACEQEGHALTVEPGHAAVRFVNPLDGRDALRTIRTEMHRISAGTATRPTRRAGSAVWQVFTGSGQVDVGDRSYDVGTGDLFAVPSWASVRIRAHEQLDAFRFSDEPVFEALGLARVQPDQDQDQEEGGDVGELLRRPDWRAAAAAAAAATATATAVNEDSTVHPLDDLDYPSQAPWTGGQSSASSST